MYLCNRELFSQKGGDMLEWALKVTTFNVGITLISWCSTSNSECLLVAWETRRKWLKSLGTYACKKLGGSS